MVGPPNDEKNDFLAPPLGTYMYVCFHLVYHILQGHVVPITFVINNKKKVEAVV